MRVSLCNRRKMPLTPALSRSTGRGSKTKCGRNVSKSRVALRDWRRADKNEWEQSVDLISFYDNLRIIFAASIIPVVRRGAAPVGIVARD